MGNCLVTKLKGVVDADLPKFDELVIRTTKDVTISVLQGQRMTVGSASTTDPITVSVDGNGYFAETYAGLDDPSSRLTTLTFNGYKALYFANESYNIHIDGKYRVEKMSLTTSGVSASIFKNVNIEDFEYCPLKDLDLTFLSSGAYGNISSLKNQTNLLNAALAGTNVTGDPLIFASNMVITNLSLPSTVTRVSLESLVAAFKSNGRSQGLISSYTIRNFITFGDMNFLTWSCFGWDADMMYVGDHTTLEGSNTIYVKGASAEQIAEWESAGKTVVVVS